MGDTTSSSFIDYNIDPDLIFLAADIKGQYYDQDEFMNTFNSNTNTKLLHINARRLPKNISSIVHYLKLLQTSFSIIGVSESWLEDVCDPLIQIPNYKVEGSCRLNRRGDGVVLYIQQDLVCKIRQDLCIGNSETETFFISSSSPTS